MAVERAAGGTSLIDVLDRVLDKGIVIDAWVRVSLVGIDLITVEARVVVASIDTYLKYSEAVGQVAPMSRPHAELASHQDVLAENAALRAELAASKKGRAELAAKKKVRATVPARRVVAARRRDEV
jgi:gas vesicle structural protein